MGFFKNIHADCIDWTKDNWRITDVYNHTGELMSMEMHGKKIYFMVNPYKSFGEHLFSCRECAFKQAFIKDRPNYEYICPLRDYISRGSLREVCTASNRFVFNLVDVVDNT